MGVSFFFLKLEKHCYQTFKLLDFTPSRENRKNLSLIQHVSKVPVLNYIFLKFPDKTIIQILSEIQDLGLCSLMTIFFDSMVKKKTLKGDYYLGHLLS